tara:strand:- start:277 stop:945 length:669 start_codon:yes stop_codon:yes gene_type:complete
MNKYITFNDTSIKFQGNKLIKKFKLKTIPENYKNRVSYYIYQYHIKLNKIGVPVPRLYHRQNLKFTFEYCGDSLIEILKNKSLSDKYIYIVLDQIISILLKCSSNKVDLDPHIKNFTIKDNTVYYVDTFPPMIKDYVELLVKYNSENKINIRKHLSTWKYNRLMYHFLADIKKTKSLNRKIYYESKKMFLKKRLIRNFSDKKINEIIKIEGSNLKRNGFTLS